jgi:hypothetical protein
MNRSEKRNIRANANFINQVASSDLESNVKKQMDENIKGALVGGGVGVLIALASQKNLFLYGIAGLIIGRILFKIKQ